MKLMLYTDECYYIKDPVDNRWDKVILYARADSIPRELAGWTEVNPRGQNMGRPRVREIRESLSVNDHFHVLNRGVVLNTASYSYDSVEKILVIELEDKTVHGVLDGGHSIRTLLEHNALPDNRYISFEIFCVGEQDIRQLAYARNLTVEVDLRSLANLKKEFEYLQELFAPLPFAHRILYRTNDEGRDIEVQQLLSILFMFCDRVFPFSEPVIRYKAPEDALKLYLSLTGEQREELLGPMAPILRDIFALWDHMELDFVQKMPRRKNNGELLARSQAFIQKNNSKVKQRKSGTCSTFSQTPTQYAVSVDLIRPLLAANAALIAVGENGSYSWREDPFALWEMYGRHQINNIMQEKIPVKTSKLLWSNLFMTYQIHVRQQELRKADDRAMEQPGKSLPVSLAKPQTL